MKQRWWLVTFVVSAILSLAYVIIPLVANAIGYLHVESSSSQSRNLVYTLDPDDKSIAITLRDQATDWPDGEVRVTTVVKYSNNLGPFPNTRRQRNLSVSINHMPDSSRPQWALDDATRDWLETEALAYLVQHDPSWGKNFGDLIAAGSRSSTERLLSGYFYYVFSLAVCAITILSAHRLYRHRKHNARLRRGLCPQCGYSLHNLASNKCPECGMNLPQGTPFHHGP